MPKPRGTYLKIQSYQSASSRAVKNRKTYSSAKAAAMDEFQRRLALISAARLEAWERELAALSNAMKKGDMMSEDERKRQLLSDAVGEIIGMCETAYGYQVLGAQLQAPLTTVIRQKYTPDMPTISLSLVIAVLHIVQVLISLRRKR